MGRRRRAARAGWLVAVCLVAVLAACSRGSSSSQSDGKHGTRTVVFDTTGSAPSGRELVQAAQIMQRRLRALGVHDAHLRVEGRRLVATGTGIAAPAARVLAPGVLQLRPVIAILPPAGPDTPTAPDQGLVLPGRPGAGSTPVRYLVGSTVLTGRALTGAKAVFIGGGEGWVVDMSLNDAGATAFNQLAAVSYRQSPPQNAVAMVLDGVVQCAPSFMTDSFNGDVQISGNFTESEAKDLATALRFGALPVKLRVAAATG